MRIKRIALQNFRNIEQLELRPGEGINLIHGENAQGKTNLIEAVWLFSGMKSFRGARESEMVRFGQENARLTVEFFSEGRDQSASLTLGRKRGVWVNEIKRDAVSDLCGVLPAVVFSPVHLSLVKDGPSERRHFLDTAIGQLLPSYNSALSYYQKALFQRNALLRDVQYHSELLDTLEIWDQNLVRAGAQVMLLRQRYIARIGQAAKEVYEGISKGREEMNVSYQCSVEGYDPNWDLPKLRGELEKALRAHRAEDIRQGVTSVGIHRDDLAITLGGLSARLYGSQGQQRSCVLALKLAECGIIEESMGKVPVILLDDVMSELDHSRRDYLLNRIGERQVFITCCEEDIFHVLQSGRSFLIENGAIKGGEA